METFFLAGQAGRLEALLEEPEDEAPREAALVCHPHPKGGGTMHNKVVYRIARALRRKGFVVLRFNYRGVNLSDGMYDNGEGEKEDARVALRELRERYEKLPLTIAGFSFGARIALRVAAEEPRLKEVIAVGFPTSNRGHDYVSRVQVPKFFVQSTEDEFGPRADFINFFSSVPEPKQVDWIEASDHFFKDSLDQFEATIARIALIRSS